MAYCCCCRSVLHFALGSLGGIAGKHTAMDIEFSGIRGHRMDCPPNGDSLRCARTTARVRPHLWRPPSTCHFVRPSVGNAHCNRCSRKSVLHIHELPGVPPADRGIFPNSSPPPSNNGRFATGHTNNHDNRPLSLHNENNNEKEWKMGKLVYWRHSLSIDHPIRIGSKLNIFYLCSQYTLTTKTSGCMSLQTLSAFSSAPFHSISPHFAHTNVMHSEIAVHYRSAVNICHKQNE